MLKYVLGTASCSYLIRGGMPKLYGKNVRKPPASLCISVVTQAELTFGV